MAVGRSAAILCWWIYIAFPALAALWVATNRADEGNRHSLPHWGVPGRWPYPRSDHSSDRYLHGLVDWTPDFVLDVGPTDKLETKCPTFLCCLGNMPFSVDSGPLEVRLDRIANESFSALVVSTH